MKQIDDYLHALFKNVASSKEVLELQDEMRTHLLESAKELQEKGLPVEASIQLAIDRFGEPHLILSELDELYRIRKTVAKWLLTIAISLGIIGAIWVTTFWAWNNHFADANTRQLVNQTMNLISTGKMTNTIPDKLEQKVVTMINDRTTGIQAVGMKFNQAGQSNLAGRYTFIYPAATPLNDNGVLKTSGEQVGFLTYTLTISIVSQIQQTNGQFVLDILQWRFTPAFFMIGLSFLFGYWLLFAVWAITNVYYNHDGDLRWVVLIAVLNVLGYFIYLERNKRAREMRAVKLLQLLLHLLGLDVILNGVQLLRIPTRGTGVGISRLGFIIELNQHSLLLYGVSFLFVGALLFLCPLLWRYNPYFKRAWRL